MVGGRAGQVQVLLEPPRQVGEEWEAPDDILENVTEIMNADIL